MDKTIKTTLCVAAAMLATGVKGETAMKTARLIYPQWQGAITFSRRSMTSW